MGRYANKVMSNMPHEMKTARFSREISRIFLKNKVKERMGNNMGYRSVVAYTIRSTALAQSNGSPTEEELLQAKMSFNLFLAEAKMKHPVAFGDEGMEVDEENLAINYLAENVKWYEDYDEVKDHHALIDLCKEWVEESDVPFKGGNKNLGGIFMRIGEELDDLTEEEWGEADWDWIQMSRQIIVDWK